jgi:iron complex outermembrane recepter protein
MSRLYSVIAVGLAAAALASCAKSGVDGPIPPPELARAEPEEEGDIQEEEGNIIVTGGRIPRPNLEAPNPVTVVNADSVVVTGSSIARRHSMWMPTPPAH